MRRGRRRSVRISAGNYSLSAGVLHFAAHLMPDSSAFSPLAAFFVYFTVAVVSTSRCMKMCVATCVCICYFKRIPHMPAQYRERARGAVCIAYDFSRSHHAAALLSRSRDINLIRVIGSNVSTLSNQQ